MRFWHDLQTYDQGQLIQQSASGRAMESGQPEIHGFEFFPVITLGRRACREDLLVSAEYLKERNFSIQHVDRGGETTLHNPGQLVIYPIMNLRSMKIGVREYIMCLEQTTARLLKKYSIDTFVKVGCPGVYTSRGKIGFIGVRVCRGVSTHGISINVNNDLSDFQNIRSCGILHPSLDRAADWGIDASNNSLFLQWSEMFLSGLLLDRKPLPRLTHEPSVLRS